MVGTSRRLSITRPVNSNASLKRFAIAGADRKWYSAEAVIDGKEVVGSSPEMKEPVAVRYTCSMNPEGANLYNRDGLPASPFQTGDWSPK
jgi:sialate O-acetylesterase